jgi:hypothetical protein
MFSDWIVASRYKSEARVHMISSTAIAGILCAHVFVYKTESCSKTMFRKKML